MKKNNDQQSTTFFSSPFVCNSILDEPKIQIYACHKAEMICWWMRYIRFYFIIIFLFFSFICIQRFQFNLFTIFTLGNTIKEISHHSRRNKHTFFFNGNMNQHQKIYYIFLFCFCFFEWFYELSASFSVHCEPTN